MTTRRAHGGLVAATAALAVLLLASAGCGGAPGGAPAPARSAASDTAGLDLVPPGYGSLRQEDVAVSLQAGGALVRLIPLDEQVIRLLSPDSYRALRGLEESERSRIDRLAQRYGLRERNVWYVTYYGLEPSARFSPMEVRITSAGREFQPLDVIPLSAGFGAQRVGQREMQSALFVFDDGLDPMQPLTVTVQGVRNDSWGGTLRVLDRERALVRSRAAGKR